MMPVACNLTNLAEVQTQQTQPWVVAVTVHQGYVTLVDGVVIGD